MKPINYLLGIFTLFNLISPSSATAGLLSTWSWTGIVASGAVKGTASFSIDLNNDLVIDFTNTAAVAPNTTAQILTGLYFDITAPGALTMVSATSTGGLLSATNQTSPNANTNTTNICAPGHGGTAPNPSCATTLAGGWESGYDALGLNGGVYSEHWGIGTSGQSGVFNGNSSSGAGNGNYGIAPGNGVGDGTGGGISGMLPYVYSEAIFVLSGLGTGPITISNVAAAYGTLPEGTPAAVTGGVPEPTTLSTIGGLIVIALMRRRRNDSPACRRQDHLQ